MVVVAQNATSFVWQYGKTATGPWSDLKNGTFWSGKNTDKLTFTPTDAQDNIWLRCLVSGSGKTLPSNPAHLTIIKAPVITMQPKSVTASLNANTYFQVAADGEGTLTYKWFMRANSSASATAVADGAAFSGASTPILQVVAQAAYEGYEFMCTVSNASGSTDSNWAKLTIKEAQAPEVTGISPATQTVNVGDTVVIKVTASNVAKYQWQYSKDNGATWSNLINEGFWNGCKSSDTLTFVARKTDGMQYRCVVTNAIGTSVNSDAATVIVRQAPTILSGANNVTAQSGKPATFSITASGAVKYQWQYSKDGGATWSNLTNGSFWVGNKTKTMTFTAANKYDGYMFRCLAINDGGTTPSKAGKLTVILGVEITKHPQDQAVGLGKTATFTVSAANATSYQWERAPMSTENWQTIPGATSKTLTITNVQAVDAAYKYRVLVSNSVSSLYSTYATLSILSAPKIMTDPSDVTVNVGDKAVFSISAQGAESYQWQWSTDGSTWANLTNGSFWVGNHASTLAFTAATKYNHYYFRCVVTNSAGQDVSKAAQLTVVGMPTVTQQPVSRNVSVGALVTMQVASPNADTYTWQYHNGTKWVTLNNTGIWNGFNTPTLTFTAAKYMDGYRFRCMLKNSAGTTYSDFATLHVSVVMPDQPDGVNIIGASMSTLTVTWTKVVCDELLGYKIYYNTVNNPATATQFAIVDPTVKKVTIIGLNPNTNYYVWVSAYNSAGESALTSHVLATGKTMFADTDLIAPEAPSNVKATVLSDYSVKVTWTKSYSSTVMGYLVYYSTGSLASNAKLYATTGADTNTVTLAGLEPGTTYYIWVAAYGEGGMSLLTNSVRAIVMTTGDPAYPIVPIVDGDLPAPPEAVSANRTGDTTVKVSWKRSPSTDVTGYSVYYGVSPSPSGAKLYATCTSIVRNINVVGLNKDLGYYFWVVAVNEVGECSMTTANRAYADVLNPTPVVTLPAAPTSVTANAIAYDKIVVTWKKSASGTVDGYKIYYSKSANAATAEAYAMVDKNSTSLTIFNLEELTGYYVWVAAYNDAGETALSSSVRSYALTLEY